MGGISVLDRLRRFALSQLLVAMILAACGAPATPPQIVSPEPVRMTATAPAPTPEPVKGAFETGIYPNLFKDYLGKSDAEIQGKLEAVFEQLFYGDNTTERVYYPVGSDMAYISDIANQDVRTEGMSYGMMIAVQLNKKEEFDRLWKWTKTYMYQSEGGYKGYFAWQCKTDGTPLATNPASDGEEWFVMALFFADGRWGSGEGLYNYRAEAQAILKTALHDEDRGLLATDLFDAETYQVVFVPQLGQNSQFTDPSYHLPHYYQLWSIWADQDNEFWASAAEASRQYLPKAVHPETGLAPNYAYFDGQPYNDDYNGNFRYDAFRVGSNVAMDYVWFAAEPWEVEQSNRMLRFFTSQGLDDYKAEYLLTGEPQVGHRSPGLIAMNAAAALATDRTIGEPFVQALWDQPVPTGQYRYYDGLLMMLGLLQVSGNFQIYEPGTAPAGQVFPTFRPDVNGKFLPPVGKALLIIGPDPASAAAYFDTTVAAPGGVNLTLDLQLNGLAEIQALAATFPKSTLSVHLETKDAMAAVAEGSADTQIAALLTELSAFERPVFLHLPYRSDMVPDVYVAAWKEIAAQRQTLGAQNVALVWGADACDETDPTAWYPGDDLVDWLGGRYDCPEASFQWAREHFKPLMLRAEPTGDWESGFAPMFQFVTENNDVVRALIYVNAGTAQLSADTDILKRWKAETKQAFWLRASPTLFEQLGFAQ